MKTRQKSIVIHLFVTKPDMSMWNIHICKKTFTMFITYRMFKVFDMRRERHNFFLCWLFHLTPPRAAPHRRLLVLPRRAPKIDFFVQAQISTYYSFFKSPNPQPIASGHNVIHTPSSISIWGFYCDICDCHILPAHTWTPALNLCT